MARFSFEIGGSAINYVQPVTDSSKVMHSSNVNGALGDFLCIPTPNTGQLNPVFHTFAEFGLIVNRIVKWQSTDCLVANTQFSPNVTEKRKNLLKIPLKNLILLKFATKFVMDVIMLLTNVLVS